MPLNKDKIAQYQKEYRAKRAQSGKCTRCAKPLDGESKSRCLACLDYAKKWQKEFGKPRSRSKKPQTALASAPTNASENTQTV